MKARFALLTRFYSEQHSQVGNSFARKCGSESVDEFMHLRSYAEYDDSLFNNNVGCKKPDALADGSTALHHALFNGGGVEEVERMIKECGLLAVARMAKTVNDDNILPIDLIDPRKTELVTLVSALTIKHEKKAKLNLDAIVGEYAVQPGSKLFYNLELGIAVVEAVEKLNIDSSTSPEHNDNAKNRAAASSKVNLFRRTFGQFSRLRKRVPDGYDNIKTLFTHVESFFIQRALAGNCYEYSVTALSILKAMDAAHQCELYNLKNPDHMTQVNYSGHDFVVIDRAKNSDPCDAITFGDDAVIIDAWGKTVIPAANEKALRNELTSNEQHTCYLTKASSTLKRISRCISGSQHQFNVNPVFNPKVHAISPFFRINSTGAMQIDAPNVSNKRRLD